MNCKSNGKCPYTRKAEGEFRHRGEGCMKTKAETGAAQPTSQECLKPSETGGDKEESSPEPPEGGQPWQQLDFGLLASRT